MFGAFFTGERFVRFSVFVGWDFSWFVFLFFKVGKLQRFKLVKREVSFSSNTEFDLRSNPVRI